MTAEWLARFSAEALHALRNRERDPIEEAERASHFGAPSMTTISADVMFPNRDGEPQGNQAIPRDAMAPKPRARKRASAPDGM